MAHSLTLKWRFSARGFGRSSTSCPMPHALLVSYASPCRVLLALRVLAASCSATTALSILNLCTKGFRGGTDTPSHIPTLLQLCAGGRGFPDSAARPRPPRTISNSSLIVIACGVGALLNENCKSPDQMR